MRTRRLICFVLTTSLVFALFAETQGASKLRRIGSTTRGNSQSQASKPQKKSKADESKKNAQPTLQRSSIDRPNHKLATISRVTRAHNQEPPTQPTHRLGRRQRDRHLHGPHRSPMRLGMHFCSAPAPVVYETVLTEEIYTSHPQPMATYYPTPPMEQVILEPPMVETIPAHDIVFQAPWQVRFGAEFGTNTNEISQVGFGFLANRYAGFGIDTELKLFQERDGNYRNHLWLGDFNIVYELFPTDRIRPRAGIGINWLADHEGHEAGINLTLGADLKLTEHFMLSAETDFGTLGNVDNFHGRITVGFTRGPVEWFAGYDHRDIGGVELQGLLAGLRFRF